MIHGQDAVEAAIAQTRDFLTVMIREVSAVRDAGGTLRQGIPESR